MSLERDHAIIDGFFDELRLEVGVSFVASHAEWDVHVAATLLVHDRVVEPMRVVDEVVDESSLRLHLTRLFQPSGLAEQEDNQWVHLIAFVECIDATLVTNPLKNQLGDVDAKVRL